MHCANTGICVLALQEKNIGEEAWNEFSLSLTAGVSRVCIFCVYLQFIIDLLQIISQHGAFFLFSNILRITVYVFILDSASDYKRSISSETGT